MVLGSRSAISSDALAADRLGMAELLGGDLKVARCAEVAGVTILVRSAQRQRRDVIDHRGEHGQATLVAPFAKAICAGEAAGALLLAGPTAKALGALARAGAVRWRAAGH